MSDFIPNFLHLAPLCTCPICREVFKGEYFKPATIRVEVPVVKEVVVRSKSKPIVPEDGEMFIRMAGAYRSNLKVGDLITPSKRRTINNTVKKATGFYKNLELYYRKFPHQLSHLYEPVLGKIKKYIFEEYNGSGYLEYTFKEEIDELNNNIIHYIDLNFDKLDEEFKRRFIIRELYKRRYSKIDIEYIELLNFDDV